jgi:hypothetical protein
LKPAFVIARSGSKDGVGSVSGSEYWHIAALASVKDVGLEGSSLEELEVA